MNSTCIKSRILASVLAPAAVMPWRLKMVGRHNVEQIALSARWLLASREHTNFTYDLSDLNLEHLAWFVSAVAGVEVRQVKRYFEEVLTDAELRRHIQEWTTRSPRRHLADKVPRYGRRIGWYALVRALHPQLVVETGTDKGLGTCIIASALLRNGTGRLVTIDTNPASGYLIEPPYSQVIDTRIGDSLDELQTLEGIDLFIHDSNHSEEHERRELKEIATRVSSSSLVLSDNSHKSAVLPSWAEQEGRQFLHFAEVPIGHWYPGGGIGAAFGALPGRRLETEAMPPF